MKYFLLFASIVTTTHLFGQNADSYNTNIGKAQKVEIKDGFIYIKQADTIIVKVEIVEKKYTLLIDSVFTGFDTASKSFHTIIKFINKVSPKFEIDLQLAFDSPIEGVGVKAMGHGTSVIQKNVTSDNKQAFIAGSMFSEEGFLVAIKSKKKVSISLKGIAGIVKY